MFRFTLQFDASPLLRRLWFCLGGTLIVLCSSAAIAAPANAGLFHRLRFSGALATRLGTGSFASSSYRNHFVSQGLSLNVGADLGKGALSVTAGWGFDAEFTKPDNASGRGFLPRDLKFGLHWNNPLRSLSKVLGQQLSLQIFLPTSFLSPDNDVARMVSKMVDGEKRPQPPTFPIRLCLA